MEIIEELEASPRGIYCGAIGCFLPGGDWRLSVAIRTAAVSGNGRVTLGAGSGIVWDSDASAEHQETLLKASWLSWSPPGYELLETMRASASGDVVDLDAHLARMAASARRLSFAFSTAEVRAALAQHVWPGGGADAYDLIVRLLVDRHGRPRVETRRLEELPHRSAARARIHTDPVASTGLLLYHKTTARSLHDRALAEARREGYVEALLVNEDGILTEGATTNLFARLDGEWVTPPLAAGLLPGIWRQRALGKLQAREQPIRPEDLKRARQVVIGNSVRGAMPLSEVAGVDGTVLFAAQTASTGPA
jgi:para-aminobenzoate synthetase/4-amino-4-deoxychorismate lyase